MSATGDDPLATALHGLNPHVRSVLRELVGRSGVADVGRPYLVRKMRYFLGCGPAPIPPPQLRSSGLAEWADRRAWELVEADHRRLPALNYEAAPR